MEILVLEKHKENITTSKIFNGIFDDEFFFTTETVTSIIRLPSASNIIYKVTFQYKESQHYLVYRKTVNKLVDFAIENLIFQQLSESGDGPYWFYQGNQYRIEEYLEGRTITIFELRNPEIINKIMIQFAKFHSNKTIQSEVLNILKESNKDGEIKTWLETFLYNWWKDIKEKVEIIKERIEREDYLEIFEKFQKLYFFSGFEDYWIDLISNSSDKIIEHTDAQETNLLLLKPAPFDTDNINIVIIDYEYAGLVERSWDLANYFIETMLSNWEYDHYPWVELYEDNQMSSSEIEYMVNWYIEALKIYDPCVNINKENLLREIKSMAIAINYYWGAWAIRSLDLEKINNDDLYFPAAKHRMRLIELISNI